MKIAGHVPAISVIKKGITFVIPFLLYNENHLLGRWFQISFSDTEKKSFGYN